MSNPRNPRSSQQRVARGFGFVLASLVGLASTGLAISWSNLGASATVLTGYGSSSQTRVPVHGVTGRGDALARFQISGDVAGLFPGATVVFTLTITNPEHFAITVTSLTTNVQNASATCVAAYLSVSKFSGSLKVPAHRRRTALVSATLSTGTPDACIGATFPLDYSGLAKKVSK